MLLQTAAQMQENSPERLIHGLAQLERNTRDLQESVMSIRMMPISFVFSRFPRVVRDLSGKLGKQVEIKTTGETTELDKSLIERITELHSYSVPALAVWPIAKLPVSYGDWVEENVG